MSSLFVFAAVFAHEGRTAPANETVQAPAPVQITQGETRIEFNIPQQSLADALAAWSRQSGLQVLSRDTDGADLTANSVNGRLSPAEALTRMLAATGLTYEFVNDRTVRIAPARTSAQTTSFSRRETVGVNLAQADQAMQKFENGKKSSEAANNQETSETPTGDSENESRQTIPEILVIGSRSLNQGIRRTEDDAQPFVVFTREAIAKSGAADIEEFLRGQLTSANNASTLSQQEGGASQSRIDLRGLGTAQTLILIDGRRVAGQAANGTPLQPDLNGIPVSAIERIEVLAATASGIYGGGATGGVVNVILRRDYSGFETTLTYEDSFEGGGGRRRVDLASGFSPTPRTNILLAGSFTDSTDFVVRDRNFAAQGRELLFRNNPDAFLQAGSPPLGAAANICSATEFAPGAGFCDGLPLVLSGGTQLNGAITHAPVGYAGLSSDGGNALVSNAGSYDLGLADTEQSGAGRQSLLNAPTIKSVLATVRHEFSGTVTGVLDLYGSENEGKFNTSNVLSTFFLPAGAPANPFEQGVLVTTPALGTDQVASEKSEELRASLSAIVKLPAEWQASSTYTWNRTRNSRRIPAGSIGPGFTDAVNVAANAGVTDSGTPFDVFATAANSRPDFREFVTAAPFSPPSTLKLNDASIQFAGPIGLELAAGSPALTVMLEHRKEEMDSYEIIDFTLRQLAYPRQQTIKSAYVELNVPVFSSRNARPGLRALEFNVAARHDDYSIRTANSTFWLPGVIDPEPAVYVESELSSTDPTFAMRYQPFGGVTLRASYGTGFLPPNMAQLVPGPTFIANGADFLLTDPRRDNEFLGEVLFRTGGNPDLRPEESSSRTIGIILEPTMLPTLRFSVDWIRIAKRDNVALPNLDQESINNELLMPGLLTRGPPSGGFEVGPIIEYNLAFINVARQEVEAYDLALDYRLTTERLGSFVFSAAATRNVHNWRQALLTLPSIEDAGTAIALRWSGSASLSWSRNNWNVDWQTRHFPSHWISSDHLEDPNLGSSTIPSQTYHDVGVAYSFPEVARYSVLGGAQIRLGVKNIFNEEPPILPYAPFYSSFGDPRLSTYYLTVRKNFGGR